ncbi:MAG TPA: DUF5777 family beta-barrel protein [Vicinamibacterales bacterium]|nr:DUF5777 family beta-barrel protein [Vicinamibacterales bacterium]
MFSLLCLLLAAMAAAQTPDPPAPAPASPQPVRDETELNVITVPTTESMHRFGSHVRITHRFVRDWARGGPGALVSDLFGVDEGAVIGLDYRFAPTSNTQVAAYRSMLFRTVQFSGRYDALRQGTMLPVALSVLLSVEGANNFHTDHAPAIGAVVSRTYGKRLALYASPTFVWNSTTPGSAALDQEANPADLGGVGAVPPTIVDTNTAYVGLATRVLIPKNTYIALEFTPRLTGFAPGRGTWGVAIEKHTRGHLFQLNFSNSFGTTYGQLARGGEKSNVYMGFNIARKF